MELWGRRKDEKPSQRWLDFVNTSKSEQLKQRAHFSLPLPTCTSWSAAGESLPVKIGKAFPKAAFFMQLLLQREVWGLLILSCVFAQSCVEAQLCNYGVDSLARQPSSTSLTMSSEMWTHQQLCLGLIEIMFKGLRIEWRHCCFYQASPSWSVDESPALWRQYRKNRQVKQGRRQGLRSLRSSLPYQGHGSLFPTYQIPLACLDKKP